MPPYDPQRTRRRPITDESAPAPVDALLEPVPTPAAEVIDLPIPERAPVAESVVASVVESVTESVTEPLVVEPSVAPMPRSGGVDKRLVLAVAAVVAVVAIVLLGRRRKGD